MLRCADLDHKFSSFLDGLLPVGEEIAVNQHLDSCEPCTQRLRQLRTARAAVRTLPRLQTPAELTTALRIVASKERARRATQRSWKARWQWLCSELVLWRDNLMRPLALPATGGLFSTFLMFAILTPSPAWRNVAQAADVPLANQLGRAQVKGYLPLQSKVQIVVDVWVDKEGRMVDYSLLPGQPAEKDPQLIRRLETTLLLMEFTPATSLGQPTDSVVRLTLQGDRVAVQG